MSYDATPVPFGLTASRTFDVFGWDNPNNSVVATGVQFRWNASAAGYELLETGGVEWGSLRHIEGDNQNTFDVFDSSGGIMPFQVRALVPVEHGLSPLDYVAYGLTFEGNLATSEFAYGMATASSAIPTSGTIECTFGFDGDGYDYGSIRIDLDQGLITGTFLPYWDEVAAIDGTSISPTASTHFSAGFGAASSNLIEGRFFGPNAEEVAVRLTGDVFIVDPVMLGRCATI